MENRNWFTAGPKAASGGFSAPPNLRPVWKIPGSSSGCPRFNGAATGLRFKATRVLREVHANPSRITRTEPGGPGCQSAVPTAAFRSKPPRSVPRGSIHCRSCVNVPRTLSFRYLPIRSRRVPAPQFRKASNLRNRALDFHLTPIPPPRERGAFFPTPLSTRSSSPPHVTS